MKKQGFTLIELMVVIVIMGILAAVAVPKLFGMIAKSKASEVGPAAGTYVKLQDAYASETGAAGSWKMIGYIGPGAKDKDNDKKYSTNVFDYTDEFKGSNENTTMVAKLANGENDMGWKAEAKTALNDCGIQSTWDLKMKAAGNGDAIAYTATITPKGTGATEQDCLSLTANFKSIAHK
ncbi:type II secretion system protein [Fibrobacter sp.]|uniref:type IV pilin protein n=1 Tax=Fibrobacter sp. TaxID=35828 RepID=UPI0025C48F0F|nr:type II secretion system protein [Fibrobacter sp.]MBR3071800.1 type II secretion system protein [Fibrobacter sp.]